MNFKQTLLMFFMVLATCFLCFSLFSQPTSAGLLTHFKFTGNTLNSGPANVTATAFSTSYTTNNAGAPNAAIQFGGNLNSFVEFTDNGNLDFSGTNNFTISFAFFFNGTSTGGLIDNCLNYGGWGVWLWSTVTGVWNLQFNYKNASVGSAAATHFTPGIWHHVAAVRNNGTISLYIDGAFRLSATEGTTAPTYPTNMIAGAFAYLPYSPPRYNPFGGKLDEIRIYNRALSLSEIQGLMPYALPLTLGDFTANKNNTGIQLQWNTLSETNTSHFDVERSTDGSSFSKIGQVNAAGDASDRRDYGFTDLTAPAGTVFYRLKMNDRDQSFRYSRIVAVKNKNNDLPFQVYPNPAERILQVQATSGKKEKAILSVQNASGQIILQKEWNLQEGSNGNSLDLGQLLSGWYILTLERDSQKQSLTFIKR